MYTKPKVIVPHLHCPCRTVGCFAFLAVDSPGYGVSGGGGGDKANLSAGSGGAAGSLDCFAVSAKASIRALSLKHITRC